MAENPQPLTKKVAREMNKDEIDYPRILVPFSRLT
jgi:hypothetical protein